MKKLSTAIFTLALLASASAIDAHAAGDVRTGTLTLQGVVGQTCFMTVLPLPAATSLDLRAVIPTVAVADISAQCNITANGYTFVVSSANQSLKNFATTPNTTVDYQIDLDPWGTSGLGTALDSNGFVNAKNPILPTITVTATNEQKSRVFLKTLSSTNVPGMYQDTLTFTLTTI
jgi:hypothetical protein